MKKVKAVQDDSGHWYIIPAEMLDDFIEAEEIGSADEWEAFNAEFSKYRTGGDLNLIQLYAEI